MSAGYASRLSAYPNKGVVGLPESYDTSRAVQVKTQRLAQLWKTSRHVVVLTGAGISTAANIPDFRGPQGIWTLEKKQQQQQKMLKKKKRKRPPKTEQEEEDEEAQQQQQQEEASSSASASCSSSSSSTPSSSPPMIDFAKAPPTLTHHAITKLASTGHIQYCITQNVDGLHRRSGLSRNHHSPVHGCVFTSKCSKKDCGLETFHDQETNGLSFQRLANQSCPHCASPMHDILLDWEDPILDIDKITDECQRADLVVCLGTSLRIHPVATLPLLAKQYVIVNLQPTPLDQHATLVIRAKVDTVMEQVMNLLLLGHQQENTEWKQHMQKKKKTNENDVDDDDGNDGKCTMTAATLDGTKIERHWKPPNNDNTAFAEILHEKQKQQQQQQQQQQQ